MIIVDEGNEMTGKMIIVLEDNEERIKKFIELFPSAVITRTAKECIDILERQIARHGMSYSNKSCDLLMLDHDLGGEIYVNPNNFNTGSEVVRWIEKNKPSIKEIIVHSYNSSASEGMVDVLARSGYNAKRQPFDPTWVLTYPL